MRRRNTLKCLMVVCGLILVGLLVSVDKTRATGGGYTFTTIDPPGSTLSVAWKINDSGVVVGHYLDSGGTEHGFRFAAGTFSQIDWPGAFLTNVNGVNNSGQIVGRYALPGSNFHGLLLSSGIFSTLDNPDESFQTELSAINNFGHIAGVIDNASGFLYVGGTFTPIAQPGANYTGVWGVNDFDRVVGSYENPDTSTHGFSFTAGIYSPIDVSGATRTQVLGINNLGQAVGDYQDTSGNQHGFLRDAAGTYSTIDFPGSNHQAIMGINNGGALVGWYEDAAGRHAFMAVPSSSAVNQSPINADGSSIFKSKRGVVPVRFRLNADGSPTCDLPPATISLMRTSGGSPGPINEDSYSTPADNGSNFRIDADNCQYVYNLGTSSLGAGTYQVNIFINGQVVGSGIFGLN